MRSAKATSWAYQARNLVKLGGMGWRLLPADLPAKLRKHPWLWTLLRVNELHRTMTETRTGDYREANGYLITNVISTIVELVGRALGDPERTVLHEDLVPPELLYGMGLNSWMVELLGIVVPMIDSRVVEPWIDEAEAHGVPPDVCSLPKSTIGMVLQGQMPPPAAMVASNMPCDGGMSQYALIERHLRVPTFRLDVPHDFYNERAVRYFVGELEQLVTFLEEKTPGRMDWDRLRGVCEERNRAMEHELDLWDAIRKRPAPLAAEPVYLSHLAWAIAQPGSSRGTEVFRHMARLAQRNGQLGIGALKDERYRVALWNPPTLCSVDLFAWAERAYGVALIMDMLTYHQHPFIDTSTPESMLKGLAQVIMQGPMARHTRGPAENFFGDLFHLYEQFDLDMIWMAGHVGCKNTQALSGMFREKCRERGIPLLIIDYDLSDTRIVSKQGIRRQVEEFMEVVMKAERLPSAQRTMERNDG